jgi:protein-ribulosamine 3-kinase
MVSGEQLAMKTIHCISPTFIPEPIGWGAYTSIPDAYFTLYGFREMLKDWGFSVDVARFTKRLAEMHAGSSAIAPGGFGFPLTTHNGNLPQKNDWCSSWEDFFVAAMRYSLRLEEEAKGPSQELRQLSELLFENVIPRLLRPVELGPDQKGGAIKPCLIHGDLWIRNFSADPVTGEPFAYDSGAFWAHNECKSRMLTRALYDSSNTCRRVRRLAV